MLNVKVMVIDCQTAGIAGDMIVGALLDLGADIDKVVETIKSAKDYVKGCKKVEVEVRDVTRKGLRAKKIDVKAVEKTSKMMGTDLAQAAKNCTRDLKLSADAEKFVLNSVETLINAEAMVHGESIKDVHLHETGAIDTLADIIGTAVALEDLKFFDTKVYSTPVAVGGGLFKFSHGTVSSPAPATLEILRSNRAPIIGGPIEAELATPTGTSILVNLVHTFDPFYPPMKPMAIGYGAGTKDFSECPNVLRVTIGEKNDYGLLNDQIYMLETNLDDVTGETIRYTMDKMLQEGASDICVVPMYTKKNRPGHILKIMVDKADVKRLARILMEETGTLGVRAYPCREDRNTLARKRRAR